MGPVKPTLSDCFLAGADARAAGQMVSENPYPPTSQQHEEWREGWGATLDLDEEDDPASNRMHKQDEIEGLSED